MRYDVIVIGGGAMGSAAAWRLAGRGASVLLLERFGAGHTRGASHGASRIFRVVYPEADYIGLARRALPLWRELEAATGTRLLDITGGVDHGDPTAIRELARALDAAGVPGEILHPEAAGERWPGLRFETPVLFHPASGRLHADRSVAALQQGAVQHGATVRYDEPVHAITVRGDDDVEVTTGGGVHHARRVVVAAGAWTSKLLGGLVRLPELTVTQEQPAHFAPATDAGWPSFIHHRPGLPPVYGLLTPGEGVKAGFHAAGPVVDPDERDFAAEPGQLETLRQYVERWLPGVDPGTAAPISCTYTSTDSEDFVVDRAGPLVVAAGFSGHGFKFTTVIGDLLADLALTAAQPLERFRLRA
ncbi:N-methyl-L-tryptophan oxidase [Dactylosporangium sp. AC04546]|uniref:N-methyl-L-tryptophan oxidase n=1 Tax=Dactylosporangium sp. AC04546 TaxID=2862460 RepID=UPI001EDEF726|nr:N-methyl-L-tryptophan oxidase [Dactylosporangium sp. AC04546]WVK89177.1 N-methyl-L-tryptophan oxidase [Dactylosporangium sp. AC04546]